jgi:hypothetical protein
MNFSIQWLNPDGNWGTSEWNSGNHPISQTRTSPDLKSIGVLENALAVAPYVKAVLGKNQRGEPAVTWQANGQTGTYIVQGWTLSHTVALP